LQPSIIAVLKVVPRPHIVQDRDRPASLAPHGRQRDIDQQSGELLIRLAWILRNSDQIFVEEIRRWHRDGQQPIVLASEGGIAR